MDIYRDIGDQASKGCCNCLFDGGGGGTGVGVVHAAAEVNEVGADLGADLGAEALPLIHAQWGAITDAVKFLDVGESGNTIITHCVWLDLLLFLKKKHLK